MITLRSPCIFVRSQYNMINFLPKQSPKRLLNVITHSLPKQLQYQTSHSLLQLPVRVRYGVSLWVQVTLWPVNFELDFQVMGCLFCDYFGTLDGDVMEFAITPSCKNQHGIKLTYLNKYGIANFDIFKGHLLIDSLIRKRYNSDDNALYVYPNFC